jgi:hypothetical protein
MERLKPLPQGFLASASAKHSHESVSPAKPAGVSSNPRNLAKNGSSSLAASQFSHFGSAIDSNPLPGQIVLSNRFSTGPDNSAALANAGSSMNSSTTVRDSQLGTFWIKISATSLPQVRGEDIDPVCIVSQSGRRLHTTEVVLNDSDPDFNIALKLDASTNRDKKLEFRIYDATNLGLDDTLDGSGVIVSDDSITKIMTGDIKSTLLHESIVEIDSLASIIWSHNLDSSSSLIYKSADKNLKSNIFLSLFPIEDDHLSVLQEEWKYLFEMQEESDDAAVVAASKHDPVLDVVPWHLCTIQNAVCSVNIQKKVQDAARALETDLFGLVLQAEKYKTACLGFRSAAEVKHARMHPDFR